MILFNLSLIKDLIMIIKLKYILNEYFINIRNKMINKYISLLNKIIIYFYIVIYKEKWNKVLITFWIWFINELCFYIIIIQLNYYNNILFYLTLIKGLI